MKLLLTAIFASFIVIPVASAKDCDKCDKEKVDKKEEGTLAKDCDKCDKDKEKKEEGTLAHCGKCEGDKKEDKEHKEHKEEKKELV
ncbi:MAG: hypothetical protein HC845_15685 [Akkermansiaceae bacterium]|nr:hypothetical protein [Akkermansiaceae bacterium]